jgi:hypothetical protein
MYSQVSQLAWAVFIVPFLDPAYFYLFLFLFFIFFGLGLALYTAIKTGSKG